MGGGICLFCNLFLNLTCHLIVHYGDAVSIWQLICILPWVSGISRTVNFGGLHLVFFWAYLYWSLVGQNMGVDPLEWGGATLLGRRTLLELSRWEIITKYFPYSIQPSLVKLDNLKIFLWNFSFKILKIKYFCNKIWQLVKSFIALLGTSPPSSQGKTGFGRRWHLRLYDYASLEMR